MPVVPLGWHEVPYSQIKNTGISMRGKGATVNAQTLMVKMATGHGPALFQSQTCARRYAKREVGWFIHPMALVVEGFPGVDFKIMGLQQ